MLNNSRIKDEYFDLFLTQEERKDIGQRLEIVFELLKGENSQREIARKLGTSIAKITRGSNCLKEVSSELKNAILQFSESANTNNQS